MVAMEIAPEIGVPEGVGCPHLLGPLNLLAHLPQGIDEFWFRYRYV